MPQTDDATYPMHQKKKTHRVTSNRNFKCSICLHSNGQLSCSFIKTVAGLIVAKSVNEQTSFSSESKQEKLKMLAQLPFHKVCCLFVCCFTPQVNSYGHCGTVSSPNHTFSWASLNKQLTSTSCTYFRLKLTTTLLE